MTGTFKKFSEENCTQSAAAISYYTLFSLPPILVLLIWTVGMFVEPEMVEGRITQEMSTAVGEEGAKQIHTMIEKANKQTTGPLAMIAGIVALIFGATGALAQFQDALNRIWNVQVDPDRNFLVTFLQKRLFSFALIVILAFLLLTSVVISAILAAFGEQLSEFLPAGTSEFLLHLLSLTSSLSIVALLFAAMFKILPDAKVAWRDVAIGAVVTAVLFVLGKFGLGFYLGKSKVGTVFGAAGSLVLILVWCYYSAMIVFYGATFTFEWAKFCGRSIMPENGAVTVVNDVTHLKKVSATEGGENAPE